MGQEGGLILPSQYVKCGRVLLRKKEKKKKISTPTQKIYRDIQYYAFVSFFL